MKTRNLLKVSLLSAVVILSSCTKDKDEVTPIACTVETPAAYSFLIDGSETVVYSGQTARLQMASELGSALSNPATTLAALEASQACTACSHPQS